MSKANESLYHIRYVVNMNSHRSRYSVPERAQQGGGATGSDSLRPRPEGARARLSVRTSPACARLEGCGRPQSGGPLLRDASQRGRACGMERARCAAMLLSTRPSEGVTRSASADIHVFTCQTALPVPAARLRPGHEIESHLRGVGGAPTGARVRRHPVGHTITRWARALARRPASSNVGRAPFGAPPWRFVAGVRASVCSISSAARAASSSQPSPSAWRAGSRTSRVRGYEPQSRDATSCSAYGPSPEDAPR